MTQSKGGIVAGSTDHSIDVMLYSNTTGQPLTGKAYGDITAYYYRQGAAAAVSIAGATLATLDAAHDDGGFLEIDATNMPGRYRFDLPDAALADGADWVIISVKTADSQFFLVTWRIDSNDAYERLGAPAGASVSADIAAVASSLATIAGYLDTEISDILADTNELQADWTNGGRLDLLIDAIKAVTDLLPDAGALSSLATAANLAVVDTVVDSILSMLDDARTEPGQGSPPVNPDLATKIDYLYKAWRNKIVQSSTTYELYDNAGTTVDQKATVSDDGSDFTRDEIESGP